MSGTKKETGFSFTIDGVEVTAYAGQTIMEAADEAGVYIPRLCDHQGLRHQGSCRVCTVKAGGRSVAACTQPAAPGQAVENETKHLNKMRRDLVEMLFHEGNHLCPICEASGNCELQAMAYRLDMTETTRFPYLEPCRALDASHPDIALDTNRCISCGRCIRASQDVDGKGIFGYVGRGIHRRVAVNGENLADTDAEVSDHAISREVCPVGCIIRKRVGFVTPIGEREFDNGLIGHEIEEKRK
ncbi:MAG: 2Fe-2S iron-sulfur cluster-binding protein [Roseibium album]|uniref:NAD-reducing hydrogenase HoxS subunit gamma n=1 Tax=Roseibium album TaxID=311410 RepID=A0A0M6ZK38_9HYPH|nr:2Fe-2S iron-sulfur cluster-binding protein [Roseibium album]MBG6147804.1 [NiFe] hydrogenase diaphorase moiety small subunit [Labrenzia sp. EL_142]MBG6211208.1 [NiFe] hydrogenase diaphorase moiety small subunit [Labrenzia sp. EL_126]CTQ63138.1 NAD-reducing hydrogenase HoxS subunit gamma [Roseibium album]CTQ79274.1 NAD-reducing hydrogenase HoxS subunit gamma [Roseibium album]CTQ80766.1 NAD-reducing hydrogenase HoxS subunit gamma [Roseibium album]